VSPTRLSEGTDHIDDPAHRLLLKPFPQRVRAVFGGQTVLDTTSGMPLHKSNLLPQLSLDPLPDAGWLGRTSVILEG
jgi:hypothetical protein